MDPNNDIVLEIVKLVMSILGPILAAALTAVAVQAFRKLGIELDMTKQAKIEQLVGDLVAQTEEWANIQVKRGMGMTAQMKAEKFLAMAADKIPHVSPDEATAIAKTIIGRFRVAAAAAVSDVRVAASTGTK